MLTTYLHTYIHTFPQTVLHALTTLCFYLVYESTDGGSRFHGLGQLHAVLLKHGVSGGIVKVEPTSFLFL